MWVKPSTILVKNPLNLFHHGFSLFFSPLGHWIMVKEHGRKYFGRRSADISFRSTDRANPYFVLQRRRSHDEKVPGGGNGFFSKFDSFVNGKVKRSLCQWHNSKPTNLDTSLSNSPYPTEFRYFLL